MTSKRFKELVGKVCPLFGFFCVGPLAANLRREVQILVRHLQSEDTLVSRDAVCRIKDMVVASNPCQRMNQDVIVSCDGAIDGLLDILRRGSEHSKYYSCFALAQLAWSNQRNSLLIPSVCPFTLSSACVLRTRSSCCAYHLQLAESTSQ